MAPPAERNIYLIGFMAAGKTTVGALLAERLGRDFVDLDAEIEVAARKPVSDIFTEDGEEGFRDIEEAALAEIAQGGGEVVALGGGAVKRPENIETMRATGVVIYLKCELATAAERIEADGPGLRPLVQGKDSHDRLTRLTQIHLGRIPLYEKAAHLVVDAHPAPEIVVADIVRRLEEPA